MGLISGAYTISQFPACDVGWVGLRMMNTHHIYSNFQPLFFSPFLYIYGIELQICKEMIKRNTEPALIHLASQFRIVAVVGPRQSGKTTLVREVLSDKPYANL